MTESIERLIAIGVIVSTEYLQEIYPIWNSRLIKSTAVKRISQWAIDYFTQYKKAPNKDIENIFLSKADSLNKDNAEDIEDVLSYLSDEYERGNFNYQYAIDQTKNYFKKQSLILHAESIKDALETGNIIDAENLANSYSSVVVEESSSIDPFASAKRIKQAFETASEPLIKFPKALGQFWNNQLTRESFVALMGPEKRGKTFMLIELAMRAINSGCNVAFFQAGDMSESQMIKRLSIYLSKRPTLSKFCNGLYIPVVDCLYNQTDKCNRKERECDFGPFDDKDEKNLRKIPYDDLIDAVNNNKNYSPCRNCNQMKGVVWMQWQSPLPLLTWKYAWKRVKKYRKRHKKKFKLSTYANETLTVTEIRSLLDKWERQEGFIPDVIVIDYADILAPDSDARKLDFRNQTNKIWQRLRSLSGERHCLVITATQAKASSYDKEIMSKKDFSEDKRKFAHVTAMYGLNQNNEEKKIGVMRLNEIVVREDDFDITNSIKILQRLQIGRPFLASFR